MKKSPFTSLSTTLPAAATSCLTFAFLAIVINLKFVSFDEGLLGQMTDRVRSGEISHVDFFDAYTGGLNYLHSFAFTLFGEDLLSFRKLLLLFATAWSLLVFFLYRRFVTPWTAAALTWLTVLLSIANYFASLPSWHLMMLATVAGYCVVRFIEGGTRWWFFAAGIAIGIGATLKITALYLVGAIVLFLLSVRAPIRTGLPAPQRSYPRFGTAIAVLVSLLWMGFCVALFRRHFTPATVVELLIPALLPAIFTVVMAAQRKALTAPRDISYFAVNLALVAAGTAIPLMIFIVPYIAAGHLNQLISGVLIRPLSRVDFTFHALPDLELTLAFVLPGVFAFSAFSSRRAWLSKNPLIGVMIFLTAIIVKGSISKHDWGYPLITVFPLLLFFLVVIDGVKTYGSRLFDNDKEAKTSLILSFLFCIWNLNRYPASNPLYGAYVFPLALMAWIAIVGRSRYAAASFAKFCALALVTFYLLLVQFAASIGLGSSKHTAERAPLDLPRASMIVHGSERPLYHRIVELISLHSQNRPILATPDCPEIYFLSGKKNVTPDLFEFLGNGTPDAGTILRLAADNDMKLLVLNRHYRFSTALDEETVRRVAAEFQFSEAVGSYLVVWRP